MLWAGALAMLIDKKIHVAAAYFAVMAGLTFFGFIHSIAPQGDIYLPWTLENAGTVYRLALSYVIVGGIVYVLGLLTSRAGGD